MPCDAVFSGNQKKVNEVWEMVYEPVFDDHIPLRITNIDTAASRIAAKITTGITAYIAPIDPPPPPEWWITSVIVAGAM